MGIKYTIKKHDIAPLALIISPALIVGIHLTVKENIK